MSRKLIAPLCIFALLAPAAATAATDKEVQAAFDKAQKKHPVAIYHDGCAADGRATGSVEFKRPTAESIAQAAVALGTLAALKPGESKEGECSSGLHPGNSREVELFSDGSVKQK